SGRAGSGEDLGRDPAGEEAAPPREGESLPSVDGKAELLRSSEALGVECRPQPGERQGLVEPEAEHDALPCLHTRIEALDLALGGPSGRERFQVAPEPRRVPPAPVFDCADRADPKPEVVAAEPVGEVMQRAEVPPLRVRAAEVRRL